MSAGDLRVASVRTKDANPEQDLQSGGGTDVGE